MSDRSLSTDASELASALREFAGLRDEGIITESEFLLEKKKLLANWSKAAKTRTKNKKIIHSAPISLQVDDVSEESSEEQDEMFE